MGWARDNADYVRTDLIATPDELRLIANRVRNKQCQCCPGIGDLELMDCGHYRCLLCVMRGHDCLACILAI
jgi:hypothetical protein